MKRRLICTVLALCTVVSLIVPLVPQAKAYGESDWVLASEAPAEAEITARKWTYTKTTTVKSYDTSMSGYEQTGSEWKLSGSGQRRWASFPSGFNTGHSLYTERSNGQPYSAKTTDTYKREVSNSWEGYIYWHWAYNAAYYNNTSRWISDRKQTAGSSRGLTDYAYKYFFAFLSTTNAPAISGFTFTWGASAKYDSGASTYNCSGCLPSGADKSATSGLNNPRFLRFDSYICYYEDYNKLFTYEKKENLETATEIPAVADNESISNQKEWVKYKNTFTVSFDANGGSGAPDSVIKNYGEPLTLPDTQPTRSGYGFIGWSVSSAAAAGDYAAGSEFVSDADTTLYAIWKNKTRFTVTYDYKTNGGTSCPKESAKVYLDENADLTVKPVRDGWTFVGWNTNKNAHKGLSTYTVKGNVTLYAIFSRKVNVQLYIGDGQLYKSTKGTYYNLDEGYVYTLPEIPSNGDWTPLSWVSGGKDVMPGDSLTLTSDTRIDAKYVKELTLSYNANGGTSTPPSQTVVLYFKADGTYDQASPVLAPAISRPGFSFDKWAYGNASGKTYPAGDTLFMTESVTLYATWTELPPLDAPTASVKNASVGKTVTLTGPEGAEIHYTTDGSTPTASSAVYTKAITLKSAGNNTVKAIAVKPGCADSAVLTETVTLQRAAAPTADRENGLLIEGQTVTVTAAGKIYYTLDGTVPTTKSTLYSAPIVIDRSVTLKLVAAESGKALSKTVTYSYEAWPVYSTENFGYSFGNIASSFGYASTKPSFLNYCIPYSSVKMIFGDSIKGKSAYTSMAKYSWTGNCCGMASTSALFYSPDVTMSPSDFGKSAVSGLSISDTASGYGGLSLRTFIEAMQISQYTVPFDRAYAGNKVSNTEISKGKNLNKLYTSVKADLDNGHTDIIAVGMSGVGAHALLAYRLTEDSPTKSSLYVYDCNFPQDGGRIITFTKNSSGDVTGWSYSMGKYGVWGTSSKANCYISFIPYSVTSYIWTHRGDMGEKYLTLTVDSRNVAIHNLDGDVIGEFVDGEFVSYNEDVFAIPNLNLTTEGDLSVYLPEDFYIVQNRDGGDFEAAMVSDSLGATVTTDSDTVCFSMGDSVPTDDIVAIEQSGGSRYTISLDSSRSGSDGNTVFKNVTISGSGFTDTLHLSSLGSGKYSIDNYGTISSYTEDGVEKIVYTVSASSQGKGTVSPAGDVTVPANGSQTFTFQPDTGYYVKDVKVDNISLGHTNEYTFQSVHGNHSIHVTFARSYSGIESATRSGSKVSVKLTAEFEAELCAVAFDSSGRIIDSRWRPVDQNTTSAAITMGSGLPDKCTVKVFLLDSYTHSPLCAGYVIEK
ncbi:MAG: InlB B-repeat-containing protein [Oscillospiraceae bacterium]|nr:InlB B-repeat-containing protein [Oscillospiraceae bacterium]